MTAAGAPVAANREHQRGRSPAQWLVSETPGHAVARAAFTTTPATPLIGLDDPAGQNSTTRLEPLPGNDQAELVEPGECAQIRAGKGSVRHVEVFRMGSVRTSILWRPRPLSRDRRASNLYTVNCEEPDIQASHLLSFQASSTGRITIWLLRSQPFWDNRAE